MREMTLEEMAMVTGGYYDNVEEIVVTAPRKVKHEQPEIVEYIKDIFAGAQRVGCPPPSDFDSIEEIVITAKRTNMNKAMALEGGITLETGFQVGDQFIVTDTQMFPNTNAIDWAWVTAHLATLATMLGGAAKVSPLHVKVPLAAAATGVGLMVPVTGALAYLDERIYGCP
jgi:hypothetical protein